MCTQAMPHLDLKAQDLVPFWIGVLLHDRGGQLQRYAQGSKRFTMASPMYSRSLIDNVQYVFINRMYTPATPCMPLSVFPAHSFISIRFYFSNHSQYSQLSLLL